MKKLLCILAGTLLWLSIPQQCEAQAISKYQAVFIYNFTKYLEWPTPKQPLVVGVMGNSSVLLELERSAKAKGNSFKVIKVATMDEVDRCDMIFLPKEQSRNFSLVAEKTRGKSILIVTEDADLAPKGAHISFYVENDKLRFIINQEATAARDIRVSSSLLTMAKVI